MPAYASLFAVLASAWFLLVEPVSAIDYPQNPLLLGDTVFVSHQGVYRFDGDAAQPAWSSLQDVETFAVVAAGDLLLVGSTQGLYALRQSDGSVAWRAERAQTIFTPAIDARAYAGSVEGKLYAFELSTGAIAWRRSFDGWVYSPVISRQGQELWTGGQQHRLFGLSAEDGRVLSQLPTRQESVFGGVDIGQGQFGFNLFDGSTVIVDPVTGSSAAILDGDSQPTGLHSQGGIIYRSHSDGSLTAFTRDSLVRRWHHPISGQNLQIHPSPAGHLLLSDGDRRLYRFDLARDPAPCRVEIDPPWLLPAMSRSGRITYFQKSMQPPRLRLVKSPAICH